MLFQQVFFDKVANSLPLFLCLRKSYVRNNFSISFAIAFGTFSRKYGQFQFTSFTNFSSLNSVGMVTSCAPSEAFTQRALSGADMCFFI